jgi:chemotaxis protein MotA
MDLATVIGLLLAGGLVGWAIFSGAGDKVGAFINYPSFAMVVGGAVGAAFISFPLSNLTGVLGVLKNAFLTKPKDPLKLISELVRFAEIARRDGILALEGMTKEIDDPFIITGIQMAVDGTDPELIEQILADELQSVADRHNLGKALFDAIAKFAPAFGMIGTLIGLVIMLQNMDDPSKIGPGMAVALLTTLYGSCLANIFAIPVADKLSVRSQEEIFLKTIVIKGVMSIQSGDNPRTVEQKLKTFLKPSLRDRMKADAE